MLWSLRESDLTLSPAIRVAAETWLNGKLLRGHDMGQTDDRGYLGIAKVTRDGMGPPC